MLLEDKKVVVTGGSSGAGLAIGRQARAEGASLVVVDRGANLQSAVRTWTD